ncbi:MAG: helix-turn-helix domain-containing protein [Candidatus Aminicenantes bacterium]|nr:helix-turn-helix domain-containing protein [Candidatus Aminicenantes bacterium]NIM79650.1 helix-turn-helix domain-containing protein [Candidatus Aminicenantes bacterium]NIN18976.1 helix-turn-helix domain-containing protein [Candidatus Aminicenantes bacterium]NIN42878.1 helix-turn-helix domain-containing protein [Candidatus Aminicenantes bacterium]NIN85615.1 helix-turn-helix domain-containing protein [Candidatus Aminicenantes bacterium]
MKRWRKRLKQQLHCRVVECVLNVSPNDYWKVNSEWVAQQLEVTPEHLSRTFLKETCYYLQSFLEGQKIYWSINLLRKNRDLQVRELAEIIGYNNVNHFILLFKKYMGLTPGRFRKVVLNSQIKRKKLNKRQKKGKKNIQNIDIN